MTEATLSGVQSGLAHDASGTPDVLSSRLRSIDCLRGAAALAVVVHHAMNHREHPPTAAWFQPLALVLDQGYLGVPLFFVISGFCIHLRWAKAYAEQGRQRLDFTSFWSRRFHRLYPPYLVALCLSMALVVIAEALRIDTPLLRNYPEPRRPWIAIDFLAHLTMLHGFHPALDKAGGNGVYWTLAREEYFYLLYFALLAWRRTRGLALSVGAVFLLGLAVPLALTPWLREGSPWWDTLSSSAVVLWIQWCLGMVAVEGYYGLVRLPRWCSSLLLVPVWAALAVWLSVPPYVWLSPALWGLTFFTLLNSCIARERAGRWPEGPFFTWLAGVGVFSYSLYLIHVPVQAVVKRLLGPLGATRSHVGYLAVSAIIVLAGYFAGLLFFHVVEKRFLIGRATARTRLRDASASLG